MLKLSEESSGFLRPKGQQIVQWNAETLLGIGAEISLDEGWGETIKAGRYRRVGSEKVSARVVASATSKDWRCLLHETAGAFEHGEGRMPFIQVTYFRSEAERGEHCDSRRSRAAVPASADRVRRDTVRW